ncbi:MAG TPA: ElyC/SanA/YdcF family protein [Candidatus Paceibacterota bacterium]|nr:ElyC/SanA/YdcF family protein [Candidatus Paceibacterota bacterium]
MREKIILPLTKSAWPGGRVGSLYLQDWYQGLLKAVELVRESAGPAFVLILSAVQTPPEPSEVDVYLTALNELGVDVNDFMVIREEVETIGQLEYANRLAQARGARLIVISTWTHYPRVRWLCRGRQFEHHCVWGIPRPREAVTDIVLWLVFPILDSIPGGRDWFLRKVHVHRKSGKF